MLLGSRNDIDDITKTVIKIYENRHELSPSRVDRREARLA
jgi:hypothetical protein